MLPATWSQVALRRSAASVGSAFSNGHRRTGSVTFPWDKVRAHGGGALASHTWVCNQEMMSGQTAACACRPTSSARCWRPTPISPGYSMRRA
jgi:hypothetical protein